MMCKEEMKRGEERKGEGRKDEQEGRTGDATR